MSVSSISCLVFPEFSRCTEIKLHSKQFHAGIFVRIPYNFHYGGASSSVVGRQPVVFSGKGS